MPADFWLEDEGAYTARNKAISGGVLVLLIANTQGAERFLSPLRMDCLRTEVSQLGGIEYHDPQAHDFPLGGMSARQYARSTPRFRLPKAFPDSKNGIDDPHMIGVVHGDAIGSHMTGESLESDIGTEFSCRHSRAHDPISFSYSDGSARKVDGSSNVDGHRQRHDMTLRLLVHSQGQAWSWRIVKRCSGLIQMARIPQIQSTGLS